MRLAATLRQNLLGAMGLLGLTAWLAASMPSWAQAQQKAPIEETGSLEALEDERLSIRTAQDEVWVVMFNAETIITVEGEAEKDCLRPGLSVQFTAEIDKKGAIKKPVEAVEIISTLAKNSMGLFLPGENEDDEPKPVTKPGAGTYIVKAKVTRYRDGTLDVVAGNRKLSAPVGDEVAVTLRIDDTSLAQLGDAVKVKGWCPPDRRPNVAMRQAGQAMAEELTITMSKPLTAGKRARPSSKSTPAKSTKSLSKSKTSK